ncbi:MAG: RNA polymerase-binding protein RbpA, partial [Arachnia sp.]
GEGKLAKPHRTHWDLLRERRAIPELEDIRAEQLTKLRESDDIYLSVWVPPHPDRPARSLGLRIFRHNIA